MKGWVNSYMFEGQLFAEIIVHDAQQKKNVDYEKMNCL